jgi:hypothetical protein
MLIKILDINSHRTYQNIKLFVNIRPEENSSGLFNIPAPIFNLNDSAIVKPNHALGYVQL